MLWSEVLLLCLTHRKLNEINPFLVELWIANWVLLHAHCTPGIRKLSKGESLSQKYSVYSQYSEKQINPWNSSYSKKSWLFILRSYLPKICAFLPIRRDILHQVTSLGLSFQIIRGYLSNHVETDRITTGWSAIIQAFRQWKVSRLK